MPDNGCANATCQSGTCTNAVPQAIGMLFESRQFLPSKFGSYSSYPAATGPSTVATADFNGDQKLDLAVAMDGSSGLNVYLGAGNGTFGSATSFTIGGQSRSVVTGDFNGDGIVDIATANYSSSNVSVLLGNGTGGFGAATNYPAASESLAVGDFNGDNKADLVTANYLTNNVSIFLGNGVGGFGTATNFAASRAYGVTVGDFNLDQKLDVAATDIDNSRMHVLLGDGMGSLGAATSFAIPGPGVSGIAAGDLNGDQKPDVTVIGNGGVSVLLGDGMGGFGSPTHYPTGAGARNVQIADVNRDGLPDLIAANYTSNTVSVLLGSGTGGFGAATNTPAGNYSHSVAVGDFNGDQQPDLAVTATMDNQLNVFLSTGTPLPKNTAQAIATFGGLSAGGTGYGKKGMSTLASYSNQTLVSGTNKELAYHIKVGINVAANQVGTWGFRVGPDFGFGGTIIIDGIEIASRWTGLNWKTSFTDPTQSLTGQMNLNQGVHVLEVYGFESCCDTPGSVQFTAPGISSLWIPVNNTAINTCG